MAPQTAAQSPPGPKDSRPQQQQGPDEHPEEQCSVLICSDMAEDLEVNHPWRTMNDNEQSAMFNWRLFLLPLMRHLQALPLLSMNIPVIGL